MIGGLSELNGERGPWGRLVWKLPNGKSGSYQFTPRDVLIGCQMIVGEGADEALEVLQTMAQRFVHLHGTWPTFADLCLKYSQPINPRFRRDGDKCRGRIGGAGCEEHRLDRRDRLAVADLNALRAEAPSAMNTRGVEDALGWFRGETTTDRVPGAVHFAVKSLVVAQHGDENVVLRGRNWFAVVGPTRDWPVDAVRVEPATGASRLGLSPGAVRVARRGLGAAAGAGGLWLVARLMGWI
jgi:hypothetical protein